MLKNYKESFSLYECMFDDEALTQLASKIDPTNAIVKLHDYQLQPYKYNTDKINGRVISSPGINSTLTELHFKHTVVISSSNKDMDDTVRNKMISIGRAIPKFLSILTSFNEQLQQLIERSEEIDEHDAFAVLCKGTARSLLGVCRSTFISSEMVMYYVDKLLMYASVGLHDTSIQPFEDGCLYVEYERKLGLYRHSVSNDKMLESSRKPYISIPGCGFVNVDQISDPQVMDNNKVFGVATSQTALAFQYIRGIGLIITILGELFEPSSSFRSISDNRCSAIADHYFRGGYRDACILPDLKRLKFDHILFGTDLNSQDHMIFDEIVKMFQFVLDANLPDDQSYSCDVDVIQNIRKAYKEYHSGRLEFNPVRERVASSIDVWSSILSSRRGIKKHWTWVMSLDNFNDSYPDYSNAVVLRLTSQHRCAIDTPIHHSRQFFDLYMPCIDHTIDVVALSHTDGVRNKDFNNFHMQYYLIINPSQHRNIINQSEKYDVLIVTSAIEKYNK